MWVWLHSWINGADTKREQVAHPPLVQMSSSTGRTVDALLIGREDRYGGPFLHCRLSFKQLSIGNRGASVRQRVWFEGPVFWEGIDPAAWDHSKGANYYTWKHTYSTAETPLCLACLPVITAETSQQKRAAEFSVACLHTPLKRHQSDKEENHTQPFITSYLKPGKGIILWFTV